MPFYQPGANNDDEDDGFINSNMQKSNSHWKLVDFEPVTHAYQQRELKAY
jgi:hypothetical protein